MTGSRRRDFLRGVGLAGVAGMPSLTGCLDLSVGGFMGEDSLSWVPAPETLSAIERFDVTARLTFDQAHVFEAALANVEAVRVRRRPLLTCVNTTPFPILRV